jgi:crotonobetainyl-CoA:carnitine CoA-transferase CaiB-like acyl-CoA transferase
LVTVRKFLSELVVVELSDTVAASFCGRMLACYGAQVIRVLDRSQAPRTSRESERVGETAAADVHTDALKTRVSLDLATDQGRMLFARMLDRADCLLTDYDPDRLRARGWHWETLRAERPGLIYTHISAFGVSGPKSHWRGDDITAQAFSGFCSMVGFPDRAPLSAPYALAFTQGGLHAAGATVAAAIDRRASGQGSFVEIASAEVLGSMMRMYSFVCRFYGVAPTRSGRRAPGSAGRYPASLFPCKDGYVVMTSRSGRQWRQIIDMMGKPEWSQNPRYQDPYGIAMEYPDEVDALVIPWMMKHARAELAALALKHAVPLGAVRRLDELVDDPQFAFRRFFQTVNVAGKKIVVPGQPAHISIVEDGQRVDVVDQSASVDFPPLRADDAGLRPG